MEISLMVAQLKSDAKSLADTISKELEAKKIEANTLRLQLGVIEEEIRKLSDYHEAVHMTHDSLALVGDDVAPRMPVKKDIPVSRVDDPHNIHHSRKAKKIGKFDPNGVKICEYPSINQAAKVLGWGRASTAKYLTTVDKDKQIRLRGFYLEYIAA